MTPPPNLIFGVADDLDLADPGCYGGRVAEFGPVSPVLDAMTGAGMRSTAPPLRAAPASSIA